MTKTRTRSSADLSCDIEVDESGKCEWTAVANAQTHIRAVLRCWSAAEPQSSAEAAIAALAKRFWSIHPSTLDDMGLTREEFYASEMVKLFGALTRNEPQGVSQSSADSEAFRAALEQLAAVARTAVSYVGYANDAKREREAQSWIRKKHEELLTSPLSRPESK
ncbi:hypothetical protein [Bradyrhizobium barranii]